METYSLTNFSFLLVKTDFLSTWKNILLFGQFFFLLVEIQILKNNLKVETDFLSIGNNVFWSEVFFLLVEPLLELVG